MKCAACGAENDPSNRFCEQCGAKLDEAAPSPVPVGATAAPICPACGAPVLPGEAFCDNCGASLAAIAPVAAPVAQPDPVAAPVVAAVAEPPSEVAAAAITEEPPVVAATLVDVPIPDPVVVPEPAVPDPVAMPVAPGDVTVMASVPVVAPEPAALPDAAYLAQKQALEAEIARQQPIIAQLEGVVSTLGVATPPAVQASLDDARAALARAQAELAALQPPAPPAPAVDPAIVAALEAEVARQQPVVTQLEAVIVTLGAATPLAVQTSLDEARVALTKARGELAALGVVPALPSAVMVEPNAPTVLAPVGAAETTAAPAVAAPVVPPPPSGPRLVLEESGKELVFPAGKSEIVIGREDPISGIYPEIDMTPYGGETGGVSRQHAKLILNGAQWSLVDLNSTNHTKIDGTRLEPNTPVPVQDGQRLQFGRLVLLFRM